MNREPASGRLDPLSREPAGSGVPRVALPFGRMPTRCSARCDLRCYQEGVAVWTGDTLVVVGLDIFGLPISRPQQLRISMLLAPDLSSYETLTTDP